MCVHLFLLLGTNIVFLHFSAYFYYPECFLGSMWPSGPAFAIIKKRFLKYNKCQTQTTNMWTDQLLHLNCKAGRMEGKHSVIAVPKDFHLCFCDFKKYYYNHWFCGSMLEIFARNFSHWSPSKIYMTKMRKSNKQMDWTNILFSKKLK